MSKRKVRKDRGPPVVIKVTVSNGQVRVALPKKSAVLLNLMTEEGEPGSVTHLLVSTRLSSVGLQPVEILAIEAE